MSGTPAGGGNSEANFKGHVEPRRAPRQLDTTEVMEGIAARRNQLEDAVQAPCRSWDLECGSGAKPEGAEAGDQRDEKLFVTWIVGDVEEDVPRRVSLGDRSASACIAPPLCGPLLGVPFALTRKGLGDPRPELVVALGRDAERAGHRGKPRVRGRDNRARAQRHGLNLRSDGFSCQRPRKDTLSWRATRRMQVNVRHPDSGPSSRRSSGRSAAITAWCCR